MRWRALCSLVLQTVCGSQQEALLTVCDPQRIPGVECDLYHTADRIEQLADKACVHNKSTFSSRRAAADFVGCHDFKQFSSIPASDPTPNPIKTLNRVDISDAPGGLLIEIDGSGFLYNQCRHMVGCLTQIGQGVMQAGDVARLLEIGSSEHPGEQSRPAFVIARGGT